jgi:LPS sulfotransferase NodH
MRSKFVLFAQGRTGSTLLGDLLRSHPEVYFGDEALQSPVRSTRLAVERMRWRHARHAVGFHVKIYQLTDDQGISDPGGWLRGMHRSGWRVVYLRRENLVRHVLSNMTAQAVNRYEDRDGSGDDVRLHVDPAELLHWMKVRQRVGRDEATALAGVPHMALSYERDLQDESDWGATLQRVFGYLDLDPVPVTTNLHRQNPGALVDVIANYAEVKTALMGSEFARYLDDPPA